jgi:hypothetical protein
MVFYTFLIDPSATQNKKKLFSKKYCNFDYSSLCVPNSNNTPASKASTEVTSLN